MSLSGLDEAKGCSKLPNHSVRQTQLEGDRIKNSRRVCVAILLSAAMLFSSVVPAYAFGPITHGYIAEEAQPGVNFDGYRPDPTVFESGAIVADVMHLDNTNMHGNRDFWKKMLTMADKNDPEEQSFGASFICHGESDNVWATFIKPQKEQYGSLLPGWAQFLTGDVGIEGAYKFLFDAYAVVERGYTPPSCWVLYPELISNTYKAKTGEGLSQAGLLTFSLGLRIVTFIETVLIIVTQPLLKLAFSDLLAVGAFYMVKENFANVTGTAADNTVDTILWALEYEPKEEEILYGAIGKSRFKVTAGHLCTLGLLKSRNCG